MDKINDVESLKLYNPFHICVHSSFFAPPNFIVSGSRCDDDIQQTVILRNLEEKKPKRRILLVFIFCGKMLL